MIGFRMPTHVHIASGCLARLPEAARGLSMERLLMVIDPGLADTEWPGEARRLLAEHGLYGETFDEVEPNPRTSTASAAADVIRKEKLRGVVALGGGSVLDAAKAAAMLAANDGLIEHYEGKDRYPNRPLPLIAIPTTCGTGSEVTWVSVLTVESTRTKISVKGESMFPDQALVDPDLLRTLPRELVAATGFDALTHALEATTGRAANPVSDALAEKAIRLLFRYLARATEDIAGDSEAREAVMRASTLAGLAFGNADVAGVHCLSESLGGLYDVPHGLTNAILLEPVLTYHRPAVDRRLAELDHLIFGTSSDKISVTGRADHFCARLGELRQQLRIPAFETLDIARDDYAKVAELAVRNNSNGSNPQPMGQSDYLAILEGLG